jgi:hypothetical protein
MQTPRLLELGKLACAIAQKNEKVGEVSASPGYQSRTFHSKDNSYTEDWTDSLDDMGPEDF